MAKRSVSLSPEHINLVKGAIASLGLTQTEFSDKVGVSRASVVKFLTGKAVDRSIFVRCCSTLGIDWEEASGITSVFPSATGLEQEDLTSAIRAQVYGDIQARCGTMRVLDMEQPIVLDDIYTSVNTLEKLSGRRRLGLDELLQDCDPENFDRFLLGKVRQKRIPGLKAVEEHRHLMILGKPGAGKTTFMKRLAILCNQGEFQPWRVPVFVTLKDYAEAEGQPKLQTYIQRQWNVCGVESADALSTIFENGHALVLLDGLDEVYETDHNRVLQDIKSFAHQFRACQCVITCRIAAREYTFEQFTEVEIADFDQGQITEFATKWFAAKNDPERANNFIKRLQDNKPIQELATNPLLLTLLCLVFGEATDFPPNRAELYKEGLDVLLKKWDGKRNIERDQIYKNLSLKRKENLLSQLAFTTFEQGDYFFKQATVEQHIIQYIRNLPGASDDEEALQLDGGVVLKSIEAQHGLLVERARGIYSFSHFTFQEYFTAQNIISSTAALNQFLQNLATHITEKRYREIFLLTAGMLSEADALLLLMKQHIDQLMVDEPTSEVKLQAVLSWVHQKASTVYATHKPAAVRAFYYAHVLDRERDHALDLALDLALDRDLDLNLALDFAHDLALALTRDCDLVLDLARDLALALARDLARDRALALDRDRDLALGFDLARALARDLARDLALDISEQATTQSEPELKLKIQALKAELPNRDEWGDFKEWWLTKGDAWAERLRAVIIEHRNIGHNWQFSKAQKEKLRQYYEANRLLVACLKSDCYVTKATRQYIEDTLLLPLSEIEKYPVPDAIANL